MGTIGCFHVSIVSFGAIFDWRFMNMKGYYAINCQFVRDQINIFCECRWQMVWFSTWTSGIWRIAAIHEVSGIRILLLKIDFLLPSKRLPSFSSPSITLVNYWPTIWSLKKITDIPCDISSHILIYHPMQCVSSCYLARYFSLLHNFRMHLKDPN